MGHQSYLYDDSDTNIYKTDGYGGSHTDVDSTERFTDSIDLTMNTGCQVDFKFDGNNSTDDWTLKIYKRRDSSWTGNEVLWKVAITISNDGTEKIYHYTIPEDFQAGHYRFGMQSAGSTTTFEMQVDIRQWRKTRTRA